MKNQPISLVDLKQVNFKERLQNLWKEYNQTPLFNLPPIYPDKVAIGCLLYLSLNPSYSDKALSCETWPMIDSSKSFEKNVPKPHSYFKKFFQIQEKINEPWTFLDLLYFRHTDQKEIEKHFNKYKLSIFSQVQLTLDIIKEIQPKLVVVTNRFANNILHQYFEFESKAQLDDDHIYRYFNIPFIMEQSSFLGSRIHWTSNSQGNLKLKDELFKEMKRVLIKITELELDKLAIQKKENLDTRHYEDAAMTRLNERTLEQRLNDLKTNK